jgi:hypothetical protein
MSTRARSFGLQFLNGKEERLHRVKVVLDVLLWRRSLETIRIGEKRQIS